MVSLAEKNLAHAAGENPLVPQGRTLVLRPAIVVFQYCG
jgi:hypothetical protein